MAILRAITEWATSPWGQNVPIHIAWFLIWVAALAGLLFLIVHAIYIRYFATQRKNLQAVFRRRSRLCCQSGSPDTRWRLGCFTGLWQPRCSRCSSLLSSRRLASSLIG